MIDKESLYMVHKQYNENSEYGKYIKKHKMKIVENIKSNQEGYKKSIKIYEQFIAIVAETLKEVSLPSCTISYAAALSRMIQEGYISNHLLFQKTRDKSKLLDVLGYLGMDVVNGYSCCRHISSFYYDIWSYLNLYIDDLYCYSSPYFISAEEGVYKSANHAVNVFLYNGTYYIYDALHKVFYLPSDGFRMIPYIRENIEKRPQSLFYKSDWDMVYRNQTLQQVELKIQKFAVDSTKSHISKKQLKEILKETHYKFDKNRDALINLAPKTLFYSKKMVQNIYQR